MQLCAVEMTKALVGQFRTFFYGTIAPFQKWESLAHYPCLRGRIRLVKVLMVNRPNAVIQITHFFQERGGGMSFAPISCDPVALFALFLRDYCLLFIKVTL